MPPVSPKPDPSPTDRRTFFRQLLLKGIHQVEAKTRKVQDKVNHALQSAAATPPPPAAPSPADPAAADAPSSPSFELPPGTYPAEANEPAKKEDA